ncbi:MAG TPA: hypothetical protein VGE52_21140, partial [Pirellulales bacterium]
LRPPGAEGESRRRGATAASGQEGAVDVSVTRWPNFPQPRREYPLLLQPNASDETGTLLALLGGADVPIKWIANPALNGPATNMRIGAWRTVSEGLLGGAVGDMRTFWVLRAEENSTLLNVYGEGWQSLRSRDLRWSSELHFQFPGQRYMRPVPMVVRSGAAIVAAGRNLARIGPLLNREEFTTQTAELPSRINDLAAPGATSETGVAVALEQGVAFVPNVERIDEWSEIGSEIAHPLLAYTRSGLLVVVGAAGLEVYDRPVGRNHLTLLDGTHGEGTAPVGVTATDWLNRFAVASEDGIVRLYEAAERE